MDTKSRKENALKRIEKNILIDIVESMIDDLTTVESYKTYVHTNVKKDIHKTHKLMINRVVNSMCLDIAKVEIANKSL